MSSSKLLVLNAGSSSLKFKIFGLEPLTAGIGGMFDRIGDVANCVLKASAPAKASGAKGEKWETKIPAKDHVEAMQAIMDFIKENVSKEFAKEVVAVGHRVVHGGLLSQPEVVTEKTIEVIREAAVLAPLHNGAALQGIDAAQRVFKGVPQVVVFDTAFHQTMPPHAYMYALPYDLYEKQKIRRYGAHGTSHQYLAEQAAEMLSKPLSETNVITCHLGNGSSVAAVKGGKCVDTSMGLTPLEGLMMGTRCGDLDPAAVLFIQKQLNISVQETDTLLNKKSGLLGIAGSNDLRTVIEGAQKGDQRCALGLAMFTYRVRKYIGAYMASLEGEVDGVVFSAGIGENSALVRSLIATPLKGLGLVIDAAANDAAVGGKQGFISDASSRIKVMVIPTDEEQAIAKLTLQVVEKSHANGNGKA